MNTKLAPTRLHDRPIAIVGLAAMFPEAANLHQYWDNIIKEVDCIKDVPPTRWKIDDYYDPDPAAPDKTYCKRGGFLPDIEFDPLEFGLPPNILEVTDVSQMLSLIVAKEALHDAGYLNAAETVRDNTGVVLGVGGGQKLLPTLSNRLQYPIWEEALKNSGLSDEETAKIVEKIKRAYIRWEENAFPGMLGNVIAGRIANRFDLGGLNCVVDAACASSLGALKMAVGELVEGRADMMITGGVDTDNSILMYMSFSKTPAFSKSSHPRPFDAASDGMMIGEGIGMVVLKRLADAERDGDRIYAVIKGIGASSDGRYKSIYAPRGAGQVKALERAYHDAGFTPATVGLIEAHGTGTVVGDQTEVSALTEFFSRNNAKHEHIALGSVKSQIGHTKAAAGAASLVKIALALHHKLLPATLHVTDPNPKYHIQESPFYINSQTRPWMRATDGPPRRAGVSSFGFGGTNYHTVLEEYLSADAPATPPPRLHDTAQTILRHAATPAELLQQCQTSLAAWQADDGAAQLAEVVATSQTLVIPASHARLGFVADSLAEAITLLTLAVDKLQSSPDEGWHHPKGIHYRPQSLETDGALVALFPGQGSQYLNMGRELVVNFAAARHWFEQLDDRFQADGLPALSTLLFPVPAFDKATQKAQTATLQRTEHAQPAIGSLSAGMYKILQQAGFQADFAAGHSFGELTALWAGGVFDDATYLSLIKARGAAMAAPDDPTFEAGSMLAVSGKPEAMQALHSLTLPEGVIIANHNAPDQLVIAGPTNGIAAAQTDLTEQGYKVTPLPVSAAFHTTLVGHAQKPFAKVVKASRAQRPQIPVYANSSGQPYPVTAKAIKRMLSEQMVNPVHFQAQIEAIYNEGGRIFVEIGPRNVLTRLVGTILHDKPHEAVAVNPSRRGDSDRQLREAAVQLRVIGLPMGTIEDEQHAWVAPLPEPKKRLTITLSGYNYVSDKTRAAHDDSLKQPVVVRDSATTTTPHAASQPLSVETSRPSFENGQPTATVWQPAAVAVNDGPPRLPVSGGTPPVQPLMAPPPVPLVAPSLSAGQPASPPVTQAASPTPTQPARNEVAVTEAIIQAFANSQQENLKTHQQYLQNQADYNKTFHALTEQQQRLLTDLSPEARDSLERTMMRFHDHQQETLQAHAQYLTQQGEQTQAFMQLVGRGGSVVSTPAPAAVQAETPPPTTTGSMPSAVISPPPMAIPPSPVVPAPVVAEKPHPAQPKPSLQKTDTVAIEPALLEVVSEKTGYPADMIELGMDMEADLGIDSIKRVEILGGLQDRFPELPLVDQEVLSELRTLQQIVDYLGQPSSSESVPSAPPPHRGNGSPPATESGPLSSSIEPALLEVVSEKTGYPSDMIELGMDMEADLGIDSIKRVEILGALQDRFPELPSVDQEVLSELRTLQQIVDYLGQPSSSEPVSPSLRGNGSPPATEREPSLSIEPALLEVVSEKTGYPADMIELGMDMEADLGIDSIKRVEILGGLQDRFPELPSVDQEVLSELRTLQQIVDYLGQSSSSESVPSAPPPHRGNGSPPATESGPSLSIEPALLEIVSEKTGYPSDMIELGMDMEADLGIDSIKRVEILGGLQDRFPELPQVDQEVLSELRTLQQIVDYLGDSAHQPAETTNGVVTPSPATEAPAIARQPVCLRRLPRPDFLETQLPSGHVGLLTDDGRETTLKLAERLVEMGWAVVLLSFPPSLIPEASKRTVPDSLHRVVLQDMSEAHLQAQLAVIVKQHGPIGGVIHLNPPMQNNEAEKAIIKHLFLMAKHLKTSLTQPPETGQALFMTVVRLDGELGLSQTNGYGPVSGGLFGLTKTLQQEWPSVYCRAIDLSPSLGSNEVVDCVVAELHDPNLRLTEVGYGPQGRMTLVAD